MISGVHDIDVEGHHPAQSVEILNGYISSACRSPRLNQIMRAVNRRAKRVVSAVARCTDTVRVRRRLEADFDLHVSQCSGAVHTYTRGVGGGRRCRVTATFLQKPETHCLASVNMRCGMPSLAACGRTSVCHPRQLLEVASGWLEERQGCASLRIVA